MCSHLEFTPDHGTYKLYALWEWTVLPIFLGKPLKNATLTLTLRCRERIMNINCRSALVAALFIHSHRTSCHTIVFCFLPFFFFHQSNSFIMPDWCYAVVASRGKCTVKDSTFCKQPKCCKLRANAKTETHEKNATEQHRKRTLLKLSRSQNLETHKTNEEDKGCK